MATSAIESSRPRQAEGAEAPSPALAKPVPVRTPLPVGEASTGSSEATPASAPSGAAAIGESLRPVAIAEEWFVGIADSPIGPLSVDQVRENVASGKATGESLVWRDGYGEWKPLKDVPELAAATVAAPPLPLALPVPAVLPLPAVLPPTGSSPTASIPVVSESPESMLERFGGKRRRSSPHPVAWVAVAVALALGVTIGMVFFKSEPKELVRYVEVPASAKPASTPEPEPQPAAPPSAPAAEGSARAGTPILKKAAAPAATGKGLAGLASLGGGLNAEGPTAGSTDVAKGSAGGGQLDSASIQRVVSNFSPSVRRGCWQPALEARSPDAPASARVAMTIVVSPGGDVVSASANSDPRGYPGLSRCIEGKVRGWKFPSSSGTTTVQVPFVFAAQ